MQTLAIVLAVAAAVLAAISIGGVLAERSHARDTLRRLEAYDLASLADRRLLESFGPRIVHPMIARAAALAHRWSPTGYVDRTRRRLALAGSRRGDDLDRHLAWKVAACAMPFVALPLAWKGLGLHGAPGLLFAFVLSGACFIAPDRRLETRIAERRRQIHRSLPDLIDLLVVAIEAGLGFDQAVERASQSMAGPVAEEFQRMLQEIRMGSTRIDALRALEERADVPEVRSFVLAMVQADSFGVPVARVLRQQAEEMRVRRQLAVQERAQKAPVKMLFPLVLCIFPGMFIVILGPALISISRSL